MIVKLAEEVRTKTSKTRAAFRRFRAERAERDRRAERDFARAMKHSALRPFGA